MLKKNHPLKMLNFAILLYYSPFCYCTSNFAIAKVVFLNLFASFFVYKLLLLNFGAALLYALKGNSEKVIALPTIAIVVALRGDSKKISVTFC